MTERWHRREARYLERLCLRHHQLNALRHIERVRMFRKADQRAKKWTRVLLVVAALAMLLCKPLQAVYISFLRQSIWNMPLPLETTFTLTSARKLDIMVLVTMLLILILLKAIIRPMLLKWQMGSTCRQIEKQTIR